MDHYCYLTLIVLGYIKKYTNFRIREREKERKKTERRRKSLPILNQMPYIDQISCFEMNFIKDCMCVREPCKDLPVQIQGDRTFL